ncbi:hypothetical protein NA57DRAFT_79543 [Rhizodiscina lignyota]|uniref:Uncharacterized protein n=1 Tax=Rhizodiscina lignyota TaxID=1504668 RepID=A0A9P4I6Y6_9PEZI|nr:hypothetical protein NA57DRAFT_79543 [Rhizodiscina lignyota]
MTKILGIQIGSSKSKDDSTSKRHLSEQPQRGHAGSRNHDFLSHAARPDEPPLDMKQYENYIRRRAEDVVEMLRKVDGKHKPLDSKADPCDNLYNVQRDLLSHFEKMLKDETPLRKENAKMRGEKAAMQEALKGKEDDLEDAKKRWQKTLDDARVEMRKLGDQNTVLRNDLGNRDRVHQNAVKAIEERHRVQLEQHRTHATQLEGVIENNKLYYEGQMYKIREEYNQKLADVEDACAAEVAKLEKQHNQEVTTLKTDSEKERKLMLSRHKGEKDELNSKMQRMETVHGQESVRLKNALVTPADAIPALTDSDLKDQVKELRTLIVSLSRAPFWSRPAPDAQTLGQLHGQGDLARRVPSKHLRYILESVIWKIIIDGFFIPQFGFQSLGSYGRHVLNEWCRLFNRDSSTDSFPRPDGLAEQWRSVTFEQLRRKRTQPSAITEFIRSSEENFETVLRKLITAFGKVSSDNKQDDMQVIAEKARSLALLFGTQRARLELYLPQPNQRFGNGDPAIENCNDSMPHSSSGGVVLFGVSPGLRKQGDARGGSLDRIDDLQPAMVYLGA